MFKKVKHRLGTPLPSSQLLRVANGAIIKSEGRWKGKVEMNGISTDVVFEVFDSGRKWDFLFGKTLLETFKATHDYEKDEITIHGKGGTAILQNQAHVATQSRHLPSPTAPICVVTEEAQLNGDNENLSEIDVGALKNNDNLFTRMTHPQA